MIHILHTYYTDECDLNTDNCDVETTVCVNNNGDGFTCECKPGFIPIQGSTSACQQG